MILLAIYAGLMVIFLTVYLIKKNRLVKDDVFLIRDSIKGILNPKNESIKTLTTSNELDNYGHNLHSSTILIKSLRHLDFMSQLENYLEESENSRFKKKVLSEFEVSKLETQITVLKVAKLLSKSEEKAA
ncbi:hypothetical protein [Winogradskyella alexanderae]|uniref:Uncharacterized protein n=1 Tax=Winogradskyella alexanderae TaxID=2877123 RepID=A0ABS7XNK8_9FLAO|nr:hypothetical protein [Winogradskyella alexanderae]MCA0131597.1 hypothetical protein [Winogradskyella alexanderae]